MKKLRIWIHSLNLFQQFLGIGFLTVAFFVVFFSGFVDEEINTFVNNQVYTEIHESQVNYLDALKKKEDYIDEDVSHYLYSLKDNEYISETTDKELEFLKRIEINGNESKDGKKTLNESTVLYSICSYDKNTVLVSVFSEAKREQFKASLTGTVLNSSLRFIAGLFVLFLIWLFTLIEPLNRIRIYLERKKNGETAELKIERHDEIGEVAEALISMNEELEKQNRVKEEMIQNISHDLKTPIATIKSYSESIKDGVYPYGTLEKSVDVILEHANRLEKKVYSLITFNKIGYLQDVDENRNVNMADVISKAIMSCEVLRNDITIEKNVESDVLFHGEEEPWRVVVENLLDNALRYAKSRVIINLENNFLEVINDGDSIEKDRLDKLFKPYEKGTKGKFGLGLSIVKRVTETYGYNVTGENRDEDVVFRIYRVKEVKKPKQKKQGIV